MSGHVTHFFPGRIPDPPDPRDYRAASFMRSATARRPIRVDLTPRLGPVLDQGDTPQCVAYSAAVAKVFQERREHHRTYPLDPDRLYRECKLRDGIPNQDGTYIRVANDTILSVGAYRLDKPEVAYRIKSYARLYSVEEIIRAIHEIGPVQIGIAWQYEWFTP